MRRSEAEGRFGEAEPAGRASVCARTPTIGVFAHALPLKTLKSHDHLGRRVQKFTPEATHTYFYASWQLIKETPSILSRRKTRRPAFAGHRNQHEGNLRASR